MEENNLIGSARFTYKLYPTQNEDLFFWKFVEAESEDEAEEQIREYSEENNVISFERERQMFDKPLKSNLIKSEKSAIECFPISEEEAQDVDELRDTFRDVRDLRAALEDYFNIYNDYAEMSADEFNACFADYTKD